MASPITCIVTLHGVGHMYPPQTENKIPGYADQLHEYLSKHLVTMLSDDPIRVKRGEHGSIYVESRYHNPATGNLSIEEGLKRLGSWSEDLQSIRTEDAPLVVNDEGISHVALVYTNLESTKPMIGATLGISATGLFSISHYAHISGLLNMLFHDIQATFGNKGQAVPQDQGQDQGSMLRNVADDVASYVYHNAERERVRSFVHEALLRLAYRDDVGEIILNTHSNGTVIALDVLRRLPQRVTEKMNTIITSGSPLRKYADLFHWGHKFDWPKSLQTWYNFWDQLDPVGDPLEPPITWHRGDKLASPDDSTLFIRIDPDTGELSNIEVTDIQIDNLKYSSGGGLQAHNYWANEEQFVKPFSDILRIIANN